jgi:UDP-glucose 4-epimerase
MRSGRGSLVNKVVLVTGGAGFLGVHVAQALLHRGAQVIIQDTEPKRPAKLAPLLASGATFVAGRLNALASTPGWHEHLRRVDYLVHLGLQVPASRDPEAALAAYRATNLDPFRELLERMPRRLSGVCLASSVSVYGSTSPEPVGEDCPAEGDSPYALTKLAMEAALADFGQRRHLPVTVLRYSTLYGPGEHHSPRAIPSFIRNLLVGQPPVIYGDGTDVHDYVYVQDAAGGTCLALEHLATAPGVYNLSAGHGWTTRAIAEQIERLMHLSLPPKHMPARGPRQCVVADIARARERLGYEPCTPLAEGLQAEIDDQRSCLVTSAEEFWHSPRDGEAMPFPAVDAFAAGQ